jgi:hypothetical protein
MRIPFTYSAEKEWKGVPYDVEAEGKMGYANGRMNIELSAVALYVDGIYQYGYRQDKWNSPNTTVSCQIYNLVVKWIERDEEERLMAEWRTANKPTT